MTQRGFASYRNVITNMTENKADILLILYEEALACLRVVKTGIEEQNPKLKGENISKVLMILNELDSALDEEKGGELAKNLAALYNYMVIRLSVVNINNDLYALEEVERLLATLYEGFKHAVRQDESTPVLAGKYQPETTRRVAFAI